MRKCLFCQKTIAGRCDKKYCDVYCRNQYNNLKLNNEKKIHRSINMILKRNGIILKNLSQQQEISLPINIHILLNEGFNTHFFTHILTKDQTFFCYDYGGKGIDDGEHIHITHLPKIF